MKENVSNVKVLRTATMHSLVAPVCTLLDSAAAGQAGKNMKGAVSMVNMFTINLGPFKKIRPIHSSFWPKISIPNPYTVRNKVRLSPSATKYKKIRSGDQICNFFQ